jgi:hypothetical protein
MSTTARTFLFHHAYDHASNALVPPPSAAVGDIHNDERRPAGRYNDERRPAGRDGPEWGGARHPPTAAVIVVVVVVVNDGGGGVGADD